MLQLQPPPNCPIEAASVLVDAVAPKVGTPFVVVVAAVVVAAVALVAVAAVAVVDVAVVFE